MSSSEEDSSPGYYDDSTASSSSSPAEGRGRSKKGGRGGGRGSRGGRGGRRGGRGRGGSGRRGGRGRGSSRSRDKDDSGIDAPSKVYKTRLVLSRMGGAIVVDLKDAHLETSVKKPHMTLLFRRGGFDKEELAEVERERDTWLASNRLKTVEFWLTPWGKSSDLIHGKLAEFAKHINDCFPDWANDRKPHVALR